jgi:bacillopeptidase F
MDIIVIFSAGNEGPGSATSVSPANYANVISVGAVHSSKTIANFSSRGPSACGQDIFPTIAAPGVNIKTSDLTSGGAFPQSYAYVSGTSFASPHIAAAAALLKSAFPDVDAALIEESLIASAEDLGAAGPDYSYGNGLVNVLAAYEFLKGEFCYADLNQDGVISLADIFVLSEQWLAASCPQCQADLNGDQTVNMKDFTEFAGQFAIPGCR